MSPLSKVFFNTIIQIVGRGIVVLASLLATAILTRRLGASGYGDYTFITAAVLLFVSWADWGTGIISVREAAKAKKQEAVIFGNALFFRLLLAMFFLAFFNFLVRLLPQFANLIWPATIASFLLLSLSLRSSAQIVFQTKIRFEKIVLVEVSSSIFFLLLLLFFLRISVSLPSVFWALVTSSILAAIFGFFWACRLTSFTLLPKPKILKTLLREALPTGALLFLFSVYNRIDIFILQSFKGPEAVGIYGLAYKIHENLILVAAYLMNVLFPILSRLAKEKRKKLSLVYRKTFNFLFLVGFPIGLLTFLFSRVVIQVIGGQEFFASSLVLKILVLATMMAYFNHLTGFTLIALGKQKISLAIAGCALLVNVFLNLLLIPRFSFLGAAVVTVVTEGLVFSLTSFYLAKKFRLFPLVSPLKAFKELVLTRGKFLTKNEF